MNAVLQQLPFLRAETQVGPVCREQAREDIHDFTVQVMSNQGRSVQLQNLATEDLCVLQATTTFIFDLCMWRTCRSHGVPSIRAFLLLSRHLLLSRSAVGDQISDVVTRVGEA